MAPPVVEPQQTEVSKFIIIPLPEFMKSKPVIWLNAVRGRLKTFGVEEADIYRRVRMAMPNEIIEKAPALLDPSPENDTFEYFAGQIKKIFGKTREQELQDILGQCNLENEDPVALMQEMIDKAGSDLSPRVIANLFKAKLPKNVMRMIVGLRADRVINNIEDLKALDEAAQASFDFGKQADLNSDCTC